MRCLVALGQSVAISPMSWFTPARRRRDSAFSLWYLSSGMRVVGALTDEFLRSTSSDESKVAAVYRAG